MNKKFLVIGLLSLFAISIIGAAVMPYIFSRQTTIEAEQTLDGLGITSETLPCGAGETCLGDSIEVSNEADRGRTIQISTTDIVGIEVNYVGRLELDNKLGGADDPCVGTNWDRINDAMEGELYYFIVGDEFGYHLEAEGLKLSTSYSLIYYADPWAGNNPGALIGKANSDSNGDLIIEGSVELNMNLPDPSDDNAKDTCDYCTNNCNPTDSHCQGAKIWLIPSIDYNEATNSLIAWNQADYLFDTDLLNYFDNIDGKYLIGSESFIEFYPLYEVDPMIVDDTYILDTEVVAIN